MPEYYASKGCTVARSDEVLQESQTGKSVYVEVRMKYNA